MLTSRRDDLRADWVRGVNRLRALMAGFFPASEAALDYSTRSPLILLTGFQTPAGLRTAGPDTVREFLLEHGAFAKNVDTIVAKAMTAATQQTVRLPTEAISALLRPKRYHRRLRHVFHMAALIAINIDGPSRDFDRRKRAEG